MEYLEIQPAPHLRVWIRCYWFLTGDAQSSGDPGDPALPDGSPELIFHLADPYRAVGRWGSVVQPRSLLVGQLTGPFVVGPTATSDVVAVRFEPHGAAALCQHLAMITDRWLDFDRGGPPEIGALRAELALAGTRADRVTALETHLDRILRMGRGADSRVAAAVREIRASHGMVALSALARQLGAGLRTLQRLFPRDVGVSPKSLARITRFQRVFSAWRSDPASLARVAAQCGYFDQAHLVRDFRAFAGAAPAAFLANQPEFTAFFTATPRPAATR
ncbi:MAG: AraC family transcriptional regulator [Gemmatimonadetes bacterium]|nr:AraC family transcriptional regulator [Gemmatimonadota bacterium]